MAVCRFCDTEMNGSDCCAVIPVRIKAGEYRPVAYGDEPRSKGEQKRCHDCDVLPGGFHHRGCDWEVCPNCHEQLINFRPAPALSAGRWTENHFCERVAVVTVEPIFDGTVVPLLVFRDPEGGYWQVLDGGSVEGRECVVTYVSDISDLHPTLQDCLDLQVGWEAWRSGPEAPWQRAPV